MRPALRLLFVACGSLRGTDRNARKLLLKPVCRRILSLCSAGRVCRTNSVCSTSPKARRLKQHKRLEQFLESMDDHRVRTVLHCNHPIRICHARS